MLRRVFPALLSFVFVVTPVVSLVLGQEWEAPTEETTKLLPSEPSAEDKFGSVVIVSLLAPVSDRRLGQPVANESLSPCDLVQQLEQRRGDLARGFDF